MSIMDLKPQLKFQWDIEQDQWTSKEFLTFKEGDSFSASILKNHPKLVFGKEVVSESREEFIKEYVKKYYMEHKWERLGFLKQAKDDWAKTENDFFEITDKLFSKNSKNGYNWPKGNYICYLSIFNCNPRFIKKKEFQAYYKHLLGINFVCIHEMLHFIVYDYLEKNFSKQYKKYGEKAIWKLSEVFNDVILRTAEFVSLTKQKEPAVYAQSPEELVKYQKMWEKGKGNIDIFIKSYFSSLKM